MATWILEAGRMADVRILILGGGWLESTGLLASFALHTS